VDAHGVEGIEPKDIRREVVTYNRCVPVYTALPVVSPETYSRYFPPFAPMRCKTTRVHVVYHSSALAFCKSVVSNCPTNSSRLSMGGEPGWQLSQGERSWFYIVRTLRHGAACVLLDEPLAALDPETLCQVWQCVRAGAEHAPEALTGVMGCCQKPPQHLAAVRTRRSVG